MARKKSSARRASRSEEAESNLRLPPFGAEFSLGPATRSYRSPMIAAAGLGMVVPSFGYAGEIGNASEMGGEAVDQLDETDSPDESADEAEGMEDGESDGDADSEEGGSNDTEVEGDENDET